MGIGISLFLIAVGAILTFALHVSFAGINFATIGVILMLVGALGLVASVLIWGPRRPGSGEIIEERRIYDDRPPYGRRPY